jgi:hypothetical protein
VISQLEEFAMVDLEPEAQSAGLDDDKMWIVNSLHEGGVPWQVLYEHYDNLFRERVGRQSRYGRSELMLTIPFDSWRHLIPRQAFRISFLA